MHAYTGMHAPMCIYMHIHTQHTEENGERKAIVEFALLYEVMSVTDIKEARYPII